MYVQSHLPGLLIFTEAKILWYWLRQKAPSSLEKVAGIKTTSPTTLILHSWHHLSLMRFMAKGAVDQLYTSLILCYSPSWQHSHKDQHFSTKDIQSWFGWDPYLMLLWQFECYHIDMAMWVFPKLFPVLLMFWMLGGGRKLKPQLWKTKNLLSFLDYRLLSRRASNQCSGGLILIWGTALSLNVWFLPGSPGGPWGPISPGLPWGPIFPRGPGEPCSATSLGGRGGSPGEPGGPWKPVIRSKMR